MWGRSQAAKRGPRLLIACVLSTLLFSSMAAPAHATVASNPVAAPPAVSGWTDIAVNIPVNAIAFDATRDVVLASLPGSVRGLGNDVVELNPSTGALGRSVYVGPDPGSLSVSQDGSTLYVALAGASRIVRVDLSTFTVVSSFSTGNSGFEGPSLPRQVAVVPGDDDTVVAALRNGCCSPSFQNFVAYHNGIALAHQDPYPGTFVDSFAFGSNASTLYGYNSDDSGFDLSTWSLDSQGVTRTADTGNLISGYASTIAYATPYVYGSGGSIVNPSTQTVVATIPSNGDAVDPVPAANRVYYLSGSTLEEYRLDTYAPVSTKSLAGTVIGSGSSRIVSTNVGVAAIVGGGALHLVGDGIGPASPVRLPNVRNHLGGLVSTVFANLGFQGLVYDKVHNHLLASISSTASKHANDVVEIDPATGQVLQHVFVGSNPGVLALSADDSELYVGLRGSNSVVEVATGTLSVVTSFPLGSDPHFGPYFAGAISVQPGTTTTVAVTRITPGFSPDAQGGVAIYDNGVQRPVVGGNAWAGIDSIAFGSNSHTLFTSDTSSSAAAFNIMKVGATGASIVKSANGVGGSNVLGQLRSSVYTSCDVVDRLTLDLLGSFGQCIGAIDSASNRAYGINSSAGTLTEFELSTFRSVKSVPIPVEGFNEQPVITGSGFAALDAFDGTLTLFVRP